MDAATSFTPIVCFEMRSQMQLETTFVALPALRLQVSGALLEIPVDHFRKRHPLRSRRIMQDSAIDLFHQVLISGIRLILVLGLQGNPMRLAMRIATPFRSIRLLAHGP